MRKLLYILLVIAVAAVTSCKQDQYYLFNDVGRVQFGPEPNRIYTTSYDLADTLKPYTFYYEDPSVVQDTIFFDIYAIGGTKDADRTFSLEQEQIPNAVNAVAGTHYVGFGDQKVNKFYVIKKGTVHTRVPIIVLRDASLKNSTPKLKFRIVANADFQLGEQNKLWRKIEITDRLSQPAQWNASFTQYYFGKYSVVKHSFLINSSGEKWDNDFITNMYAVGGLLSYYQLTMKTALINYNNAHPGAPLVDEFGEVVVFP